MIVEKGESVQPQYICLGGELEAGYHRVASGIRHCSAPAWQAASAYRPAQVFLSSPSNATLPSLSQYRHIVTLRPQLFASVSLRARNISLQGSNSPWQQKSPCHRRRLLMEPAEVPLDQEATAMRKPRAGSSIGCHKRSATKSTRPCSPPRRLPSVPQKAARLQVPR